MQFGTLNQRHPEADEDRILDRRALYRGGELFESRVRRFLLRNEREPEQLYEQRVAEAHYRNYFGAIISYLTALLFQQRPTVRLEGGEEAGAPPDDFVEWRKDCNGDRADLDKFLHDLFVTSSVHRTAWFSVDTPNDGGEAPKNRAEWRARGLHKARLRHIPNECVLDWEEAEGGGLLWLIERSVKIVRPSPAASRTLQVWTWRVHDAERTQIFELRHDVKEPPKPETIVPSVADYEHGLGLVPVQRLVMPEDLWIGERLEMPQLAHFRTINAQSWGIKKTCYPVPVLKENVDIDRKTSGMPTMGAGYGLRLRHDEDFYYASPDGVAFEAIAKEASTHRDEIYRVVHQMAQGVDNNAASVGRSGQSKLADAEATRVILMAYADQARELYERVLDLYDRATGQENEWKVEGFKDFQIFGLATLLETAIELEGISMPSKRFQLELKTRLANTALSDLDQEAKDEIRQELQEGIEANHEHAMAMQDPERMKLEGPDEQDDEDEGDEDNEDKPPPQKGKPPRGKPRKQNPVRGNDPRPAA